MKLTLGKKLGFGFGLILGLLVFSSAILAGTQQSRRDEAKKAFDGAWSAVGQDLAELDKLASRWSAQADEDRLNGVKEQLPTLRAVQDKRDRPCGQRRKEMRG